MTLLFQSYIVASGSRHNNSEVDKMNIVLFLRSFARCCFFITTKNRQSDLNKAKYIASLDRIEENLNKEEDLGYQRHFIAVGNRMRRAAEELSNAN